MAIEDWQPLCHPLTLADAQFIKEAAIENTNASGGDFTEIDLLLSPRVAAYMWLDYQRGDFGYIAKKDGVPCGAIWAQYFSGENPGFAYISDEIPEVSIYVSARYRRSRLAWTLGGFVVIHCIENDIPGISLNVQHGNSSRSFYEMVGFKEVSRNEESAQMLLTLSSEKI